MEPHGIRLHEPARRLVLIAGCGLILWAVFVAASGGVTADAFGFRLTSRTPGRPLAAGAVLVLLYATLARRRVAADLGWITAAAASRPSTWAAMLALATVALSSAYTVCTVGTADVYGYVTQADLWLRGHLIVHQPFSEPLALRSWALAPENADFDAAVAELRAAGCRPYVLLEAWEREEFKARFATHSRLALLDWMPVAEMKEPAAIALYDLDAANRMDWPASVPPAARSCRPPATRVAP
jgi:hypothetical protein